ADIEVAAVVAGAVAVERDIHGARIESRWFHLRDVRELRCAGDLRRHIRPRGTTVLRYMHETVIRASPEKPRILPRLGDAEQRGVAVDAVVLRDGDRLALHTHQFDRVAIEAGGEVAADGGPGVAAIGGHEEL